MAKKTYTNPVPFEVDIENVKGEIISLKSKPTPPSVMDALVDIAKEKDATAGTVTVKQMVLLFGNTEEYYEQFDFGLLNNILLDMTDEYKKKMGVKSSGNMKS